MKVSQIKKIVDKKPRQIIKEIAGVSDAMVSDSLSGKSDSKGSKMVLKVAADLADGLEKVEKELKAKYAILS